jgi:hypothetical protein
MRNSKPSLAALTITIVMLGYATFAVAQSQHFEELSNAPFSENRPTPETSKLLKDELLFQRATQTYLWESTRWA